LQRKLGVREHDPATIRSVIEALQEEGLQSDRRFTEAFVHSRIEKGYGPVRIVQELRERGVSDELIHLLVDRQAAEWQQLASRVRRKRFGPQPPADLGEKARQSRFLRHRGFSGDHIRRVLDTGDE